MHAYQTAKVKAMNGKRWGAYVYEVAGDRTQAEIAAAAGVNQSTVGRWLDGRAAPTAPAVVAMFCRAYGRNPLAGFVAAGFLLDHETGDALAGWERRELRRLPRDDAEWERVHERIEVAKAARPRGRRSQRQEAPSRDEKVIAVVRGNRSLKKALSPKPPRSTGKPTRKATGSQASVNKKASGA